MKIPLTKGFDPYWLTRASSDTKPVPTRDGNILRFPTFIEKGTKEVEDPRTKEKTLKTYYTYYPVELEYRGDNVNDYHSIKLNRWSELRNHFYGPTDYQHEMSVKGTLIAHQLAVRALFPKERGADLPEDMIKFNDTYTTFWTYISNLCQKYSIPYVALPDYFDSSYLLTLAAKYGITGDELAEVITKIQLIVDDLFSNGRRWKELMPKPSQEDLLSLL